MDTEKTTAHLLQLILETVLFEKPYPGQIEGTTFFPDREWVVGRRQIVLADRYLEGRVELDIDPYDFEVLSEEQLQARAAGGGFPYFRVSEADIEEHEATVSLELRWMTGDLEGDQVGIPLGGGGVRVRFEHVAGEWQAPAGAIATWMS